MATNLLQLDDNSLSTILDNLPLRSLLCIRGVCTRLANLVPSVARSKRSLNLFCAEEPPRASKFNPLTYSLQVDQFTPQIIVPLVDLFQNITSLLIYQRELHQVMTMLWYMIRQWPALKNLEIFIVRHPAGRVPTAYEWNAVLEQVATLKSLRRLIICDLNASRKNAIQLPTTG